MDGTYTMQPLSHSFIISSTQIIWLDPTNPLVTIVFYFYFYLAVSLLCTCSSGVEFNYFFISWLSLGASFSTIQPTHYSVLWYSQPQSAEHNFHQMIRKCSPIKSTSAPTSSVIICGHRLPPPTFWKHQAFSYRLNCSHRCIFPLEMRLSFTFHVHKQGVDKKTTYFDPLLMPDAQNYTVLKQRMILSSVLVIQSIHLGTFKIYRWPEPRIDQLN